MCATSLTSCLKRPTALAQHIKRQRLNVPPGWASGFNICVVGNLSYFLFPPHHKLLIYIYLSSSASFSLWLSSTSDSVDVPVTQTFSLALSRPASCVCFFVDDCVPVTMSPCFSCSILYVQNSHTCLAQFCVFSSLGLHWNLFANNHS